MRQVYHVARADFRQRIRSRRLLIVLGIVVYVGYLVNVGSIELAYQVVDGGTASNYYGEPTSAYVGLKAGLTGAAVVLLGGFYLMNSAIERDRSTGVERLIASAPIEDRAYVLGKWLSNVALGVLVLVVLGGGTLLNHAIHGQGGTDPVALLVPLVVFAVPLCSLVGAFAVLFEAVDRLSGTLGNVTYFVFASVILASIALAQDALPAEIPVWVKIADPLGHLGVYELTAEALLAEVPGYQGGPPSIGTLAVHESFTYDGRAWPAWIYGQRLGVAVLGLLVAVAATVPFARFETSESAAGSGWVSRVASAFPSVRSTETTADVSTETGPTDTGLTETPTLTPVDDRDAAGFGRLFGAELRLAIRGHPWWWYAGALVLVAGPLLALLGGVSGTSLQPFRRGLLPIAAIWPLFVWSAMGSRTVRHDVTDLVLASRHPVKQLLAEYIAGVTVGLGIASGTVVLLVGAGEPGLVLGLAGIAVFPPALAIAAGIWSRSARLFEIVYLIVWYAGPLNGGVPLDFAGSTTGSVETGVPLVYVGLGVVLLGAAVVRRKREIG